MCKPTTRQAIAALAAAIFASPAAAGSVAGTATYRERIALPPDAVFEATLQDVSRADAPARVIGRSTRDPAGQPPFRFTIHYDDQAIRPGHRYAVRAAVHHQGQLLFTTDTHVSAFDAPGVPLQLRMVSASRPPVVPEAGAPDSPLRGTYWKLVQLNGAPVTVAEQQREPHLVLSGTERRVAGHGGCNRMMGGFDLEGDRLRFKELAGTMMACADGMPQETQFHRTLESVASYRIQGPHLEMLDASRNVLARFEAVALR